MLTLGNHEEAQQKQSGVSLLKYLAYDQRVLPSLPNNGRPGSHYYSWNYGRVHFIAMDTTSKFSNTSDQYQWLKTN